MRDIKSLKKGSSPGPDGISYELLSGTGEFIKYPLRNMIRLTFENGTIPSDWRFGNIIPILKRGNKEYVENYRPISLTSTVCKIAEKVVYHQIYNAFQKYRVIPPSQYGFTNKRSINLQMLNFFNVITKALDNGLYVDVIYLDFKRAFDSVPIRLINIQT